MTCLLPNPLFPIAFPIHSRVFTTFISVTRFFFIPPQKKFELYGFSYFDEYFKRKFFRSKRISFGSNFCFYSEVVKWNSRFITVLEWLAVAASVKHDSLAAFPPPGNVRSRWSRCSAFKCHVAAFADDHIGTRRIIQNIGWHWKGSQVGTN